MTGEWTDQQFEEFCIKEELDKPIPHFSPIKRKTAICKKCNQPFECDCNNGFSRSVCHQCRLKSQKEYYQANRHRWLRGKYQKVIPILT
jgi:hypothetical protein